MELLQFHNEFLLMYLWKMSVVLELDVLVIFDRKYLIVHNHVEQYLEANKTNELKNYLKSPKKKN